jgi:endonuclease/exonuclease/phosphatase family metal-dependent hydrolase
VSLRVLSWNLFHGRDFPPDPALFTWRSRLLRITERNETHLQVNRELLPEFAAVLAGAEWDLALLQECPPRWAAALARACGAEPHPVLTSRNTLGGARAALARLNPDLVASNEGGSNLTLARGAAGLIAERRELVLRTGPKPERRTMAFTRLAPGPCAANLHASTADGLAAEEVERAAECALEWSAGAPVVLGGDFNLRPRQAPVFAELARRLGFSAPADPEAIDHLLARGLEVLEPAAAWTPERREVHEGDRAIRLADHAPVEALFG